MSNKIISLKTETADLYRNLVEPIEGESWESLLTRVSNEFILMQASLHAHGLLEELHPKWKYDFSLSRKEIQEGNGDLIKSGKMKEYIESFEE